MRTADGFVCISGNTPKEKRKPCTHEIVKQVTNQFF